jgi:hypothetical protein
VTEMFFHGPLVMDPPPQHIFSNTGNQFSGSRRSASQPFQYNREQTDRLAEYKLTI